jgi:putative heme iron utilization protein
MDRAKGFARSCRELAARARFGALATVAGATESGWPFATLVAVSFDARGLPLLLLSRLAEHTKNLEACPRASLLVSSADIARESVDPLAQGRMTLVGECRRLERGAGASDDARARFLTAHPEAAVYAAFPDFDMWRLEVAHVRWVGGFGAMDWVSREDYAGAVLPGDSGDRTC